MTINVLIDATSITREKAGVGVYAKNLIHHLMTSHPDIRLYLLAQDDDPDFDYRDNSNVTIISVPATFCRKLPFRFLAEQLLLPFLLFRHKIQVLHSLHYSFPLLHPGVKQVVTLHDMTSFNMREVLIPQKAIYYRTFIRAAVRYADKLIFVSHSTQRDCDARLHLREQTSTVIHLGKSEAFTYPPDLTQCDRVRRRYNLPSTFVLYIGTIEPRKNLSRLVSAFASIAGSHKDCALVIAGKKGWMYDDLFETIRNLNMQTRIIFTGFVSEEDKPFLIQAATVFAYPSLYEGFGIPVLEAMACGVPTVTSNVSSIPEVASDAALLINPINVNEITSALDCLLSNPDLRDELRRKSILQAAQFTWNKTAALTAQVYRDLFTKRSS